MQNVSPFSFNADDDTDNFEDIDRIFSRLQHFNPPADMVARIMGAVAKLPSPQQLQKLQQETSLTDQDGMIVWYDDKEPS